MPDTDRAPLRTVTGLRFDPEVLELLDQYRVEHRMRPTRTLVIETAVREFLERETGKSVPVRPRPQARD